MRTLLTGLVVAAALATSAGVADAADPACSGSTLVAASCTFTYAGGQLTYQAQNVRVVTGGIIHDDKVTLTVHNLTRNLPIASCTATAIAAGCGAVRAPGPNLQVGDDVLCTVSQQGARAAVYACG